jgi:hypothetical protein
MSWETYYNFPIAYRRWTMKRLNDEIKKSQEQGGGNSDVPTHAAHHNDPSLRAMLGKHHVFAPPKLRR